MTIEKELKHLGGPITGSFEAGFVQALRAVAGQFGGVTVKTLAREGELYVQGEVGCVVSKGFEYIAIERNRQTLPDTSPLFNAAREYLAQQAQASSSTS